MLSDPQMSVNTPQPFEFEGRHVRVVDHATNMQNKRSAMSNNKSCGLLGVTWNKQHKRWQSKLMVDGKNRHIGYFSDPESAHAAYVSAKRRLHAGRTI